jgi:isocitrate dehydrogenase
MSQLTSITVARGDGIGPEIMDVTLKVLEAIKAPLKFEFIEVGEKVYLAGHSSGINPDSWNAILKNPVMLKGPITTPQGKGFKSINVTLRKSLGLYANVRPCVSLSPFIYTRHPQMDLIIVRENEEDVYAGIEHRQTHDVYQCLKLITRSGCERVIRYAFELAKAQNRKKVTCFTKDNIMKMTDGLFRQVFDEIGAEYPDLRKEHLIVDIGAARLADTPERFDVLVMPNLYGDILSDVAAQISGSVGLAGSANIGEKYSMFEAVHGSAPDIAGQNIANPTGILLSACQMLAHIGLVTEATLVHNAILKTIEEGAHTADIFNTQTSKFKLGTQQFGDAIISNLGQAPKQLKSVRYQKQNLDASNLSTRSISDVKRENKVLVGVDVFISCTTQNPNDLGVPLSEIAKTEGFELQLITNRGVKVFPTPIPSTYFTDHWRCRFHAVQGTSKIQREQIWKLLKTLDEKNFEVIKTENLYEFNGIKGYSLAHGQ